MTATPTDDDMNPPELSVDEQLAMDVALGALGRDARRAAETRMRSDPAFRALVDAWHEDLAPLGTLTPLQAPPAAVWEAIAAEIAPARPSVAPVAAKPGLWNSLALWRGLALAGTAAAAIAVTLVGPAAPPPTVIAAAPPEPAPAAPPQILVAALAGADGKPLLSAAYDPLRGAVVITPATQREDNDKDAELWVIEGDQKPRSLGVIDIKGPNAHAITSRQLKGLTAGAVLAISIEPRGGSPTGQPTGPIVATGTLSAV